MPLKDGTFGSGQVLDLMMPNVVRCCFYDGKEKDGSPKTKCVGLPFGNLIACLAVSREQLDWGNWVVVGCSSSDPMPKREWPNEQFRHKRWVGAKMYDANLAEDFLNAYHALEPWDDWANPDYLDSLLLPGVSRPDNLIFMKRK